MDWLDVYRDETEPDSERVGRLRGRVQERRRQARRGRNRPWIAVLLPAGVAFGWWTLGRDGPISEQELEAEGAPQMLAISRDVGVRFDGKGQINGTEREPHIRWEAGTLIVEVKPDRGVKLDVTTREATVRVIGTGFTVQRDALGTLVEVAHGKVEVMCAGKEPTFLEKDEAALCLPTSPASLLARAALLRDRGAEIDTVLGTVDSALSSQTEPSPVRNELLLLRMQALAEAEQPAVALADANRYLDSEDPYRRDEVLRFAAAVAMESKGCGRAHAYLQPLARADAPTSDLLLLADCAKDPREVSSLLALAQARAATVAERGAVAARTAGVVPSTP